MSSITAYPLTWPHQHPRTQSHKRKEARFSTRNDRGYGQVQLTVGRAIERLISEIEAFTPRGHAWRIDPEDTIISTNLELRRRDGLPRSGQAEPSDPGVAVYFNLDGEDRCLPCDQYDRVADNIAAIAATLEALRKIERHGSQMFNMAFTGFTALPSPTMLLGRNWRDVLDYHDGNDLAEATARYRRLRSQLHPDHGGTVSQFDELEKAYQQAREALAHGSGEGE